MKNFWDLSYEDLNAWAGQKTVSKGKSYQKNKRVIRIYQISEQIICGSVQGTDMYDTVVSVSDTLTSTCSCPVGIDCKHGVALILECLNRTKQEIKISKPPADEYVNRYQPLLESKTTFDNNCSSSIQDRILVTEEYLQKFSKKELITMILSSIEGTHDITLYLDRKQKMDHASPDSLITTIIAEIDEVTSQEIEYSEWYEAGDGNCPDYSGIIESFSILIETKKYTDIITLGLILLQKANNQVEMDDDCGSISSQVTECMTMVAEALALSDLPIYRKLLSAIEFVQTDEYSLTEDILDFFNESHPASEWSKVADILLGEQGKNATGKTHQSHQYTYSPADWIEIVLERAGRVDEAIAFSKHLADKENRNLPFIALLARTNHKKEAIDRIQKVVRQISHDIHAPIPFLREMRRIHEESAEWLMIAALDTEDFLRKPTTSAYKQMMDSAKKAGIADSIRPHIYAYLKEGTILSPAKRGSVIPGLLPETGVTFGNRYAPVKPPVRSLLLEMALESGDPDEVIRWYNPNSNQTMISPEEIPVDRIADVIAGKYPDEAIEIWKRNAEHLINIKNPDFYHYAVMYLMKIRDTSMKNGKTAEFSEYILHLKTEHARKRRFIQELAVVEGRKILDDL